MHPVALHGSCRILCVQCATLAWPYLLVYCRQSMILPSMLCAVVVRRGPPCTHAMCMQEAPQRHSGERVRRRSRSHRRKDPPSATPFQAQSEEPFAAPRGSADEEPVSPRIASECAF